jgi:transcriptional regulator with GAF, ATPase, and Fis domain
MLPECPDQTQCLHLVASAGTTERIDGAYRRFPIGAREVGMAVVRQIPYLARGGIANRSLAESTWLSTHQVRTFVAVPLVRDGVSVGVLALFSRRELTDAEVGLIAFAADQALGAHAAESGPDPPPSRLTTSMKTVAALPPAERTLAEIEREAIERTLERTAGRISGPRGAAAILGLHPNTLTSRMLKLGVKRPRG